MPLAVQVVLELSLESGTKATVHPNDLHYLVSRWLDAPESGPVTPNAVGHKSKTKPFSLGEVTRLDSGRFLGIELRFFDDSEFESEYSAGSSGVFTTLTERVNAAAQGSDFMLGRYRFRTLPHPLSGSGERYHITAQQSWHQLAQSPPADAWRLTFSTPTTFHFGDAAEPFPTPTAVFRSLASRWNRFAPQEAPQIELDQILRHWAIGTEKAALRYPDEPVRIGKRSFPVFSGSMQQRLIPNRLALNNDFQQLSQDDQRASLHRARQQLGTLLAFTRFSNIGAFANYGLGATQAELLG